MYKDTTERAKKLRQWLQENGVRVMTPEEEQEFFREQQNSVSVIFLSTVRKENKDGQ